MGIKMTKLAFSSPYSQRLQQSLFQVVLMLVLDLPLVLVQVDQALAVILELHLTTIGEIIPTILVLDQIIGDQILETLVVDQILICMGDQCPMDPSPSNQPSLKWTP